MEQLDYECTCWGCTLPQWLPEAVLAVASEAYIIRHAYPVMRKAIQGRWHVCRDAPDVVVESLADGWMDIEQEEIAERVQSDAIAEYQLRLRKQRYT